MLYRTAIPRVTLLGLVLIGMVALTAAPSRAQQAKLQQTKAIRLTLDSVQPDLKLTDVTLADALDYIRETAGVNVVVDWKSLEAVNIDRNTLINLHLHSVTLRKALTMMLNEAGAGNLLTFYVQDNIVQITTGAKADTVLYTMVYPVGDLLITIPNYQINDISSVVQQSGGGGGFTIGGNVGSGGGGGLGSSLSSSSSGGSTVNSPTNSTNQTPAQQGAALVTLIKTTIRPEVWKDNGGNSSIQFFNNSLIITAPISVQEAIGGPVN